MKCGWNNGAPMSMGHPVSKMAATHWLKTTTISISTIVDMRLRARYNVIRNWIRWLMLFSEKNMFNTFNPKWPNGDHPFSASYKKILKILKKCVQFLSFGDTCKVAAIIEQKHYSYAFLNMYNTFPKWPPTWRIFKSLWFVVTRKLISYLNTPYVYENQTRSCNLNCVLVLAQLGSCSFFKMALIHTFWA